MFRCDHCGAYADKSEACENPIDPCSCICQDCESELNEDSGLYAGIDWSKELKETMKMIKERSENE